MIDLLAVFPWIRDYLDILLSGKTQKIRGKIDLIGDLEDLLKWNKITLEEYMDFLEKSKELNPGWAPPPCRLETEIDGIVGSHRLSALRSLENYPALKSGIMALENVQLTFDTFEKHVSLEALIRDAISADRIPNERLIYYSERSRESIDRQLPRLYKMLSDLEQEKQDIHAEAVNARIRSLVIPAFILGFSVSWKIVSGLAPPFVGKTVQYITYVFDWLFT